MEVNFRNLLASEVEARLGRSEGHDSVPIFLYKDARCDQRLLDETVGAMNWQKRYTNGNTNCIVSIWDKDKEQWVEKEDVGTAGTGVDAKKALASDACKRACFAWGLGRELYTTPKLCVPKKVLTNFREGRDSDCCDNTFRVTVLECSEKHVITNVEIEVLLNGKPVYTVSSASQSPESSSQSSEFENSTTITEADVAVMYAKAELAGSGPDGVARWIGKKFGFTDVYQLTLEQYQYVCQKLDEQAMSTGVA